MSSFTVTESRTDTATILSCRGRLDNNATGILEAGVAPLFAAGSKNMILDFNEVDYLSSAGVRSLLIVLKKSKVAGCHLSLCSVPPTVSAILDLSGFQRILPTHPDRSMALAAVAKSKTGP